MVLSHQGLRGTTEIPKQGKVAGRELETRIRCRFSCGNLKAAQATKAVGQQGLEGWCE